MGTKKILDFGCFGEENRKILCAIGNHTIRKRFFDLLIDMERVGGWDTAELILLNSGLKMMQSGESLKNVVSFANVSKTS